MKKLQKIITHVVRVVDVGMKNFSCNFFVGLLSRRFVGSGKFFKLPNDLTIQPTNKLKSFGF